MRLRNRLFVLVSVAVVLTVTLVTWIVSSSASRAFEALDEQRTAALVAELRREFARGGEEVVRRVERIAASDEIERVAIDLGSASPDYAPFVNEAGPLATTQALDFLDLVATDGTIISSAHWPARFGYRHPWIAVDRPVPGDKTTPGASPAPAPAAFLQMVELPAERALDLIAVRTIPAGERSLYITGGRRVDELFLRSLALPAGMRALLYRNLEPEVSRLQLVDASGTVAQATAFEPLIARVRDLGQEVLEDVQSPDGPETVHALPLKGREGAVVGVLLVASSGRERVALVGRIRWAGVGLGALGVLFGLAVSYGVAARVTHPVEQLAAGARAVAEGDWNVHLDVQASGEIGELAHAFDTMTRQLADQRERLVQAERVAAWRELARRLAHELKNPLFPLRLTIDNLQRAKRDHPLEFDEVFEESLATLSTGLGNLNAVIGRFSDFARMPAPTFEHADPNVIVERTLQLFDAQLRAPDRPAIEVTKDLEAAMGTIRVDVEQLGRALQNLVLNGIDAMPAGGTLAVRTRRLGEIVRLEVADTGEGLTEEERDRLFTPYDTTKLHGTGLGLAIVQSVVADHGGRIWVESERTRGTTFHIELPCGAAGE